MANKQLFLRYSAITLLAVISIVMVLSYAKNYRYNNQADPTTYTTPPATTDKISELLQRIADNDGNIKAIQHLFDVHTTVDITSNNNAPLHDMVLGIKDLFRLQDYDSNAGLLFPVWANAPAMAHSDSNPTLDGDSENSEAIEQLISAGATLLATTQLTEGASTQYNTQCLADGSCPPNNPFAPGILWQGDSSSGCGAGLAAGFFDACIATDTSGSIRNPCLMNSLVCIKPSRATISRNGVWPLSERLDSVGVMARNSEDLLNIMQVYDTKITSSALQPLTNLTIGVDRNLITTIGEDYPALADSLNQAISDYKNLGVTIIDIDLQSKIIEQMEYLANNAETTIGYDAYRIYKELNSEELALINNQLTELWQSGEDISDDDINTINNHAEDFNDSWQELYNTHDLDAVLLFVWGLPAPLESEIPEIVTNPELFAEAVRYMVPFNYIDSPLVVVPQQTAADSCKLGSSSCSYEDRPMAFQLIGNKQDGDALIKLLSLSQEYEDKRGELQYPFMTQDTNN